MGSPVLKPQHHQKNKVSGKTSGSGQPVPSGNRDRARPILFHPPSPGHAPPAGPHKTCPVSAHLRPAILPSHQPRGTRHPLAAGFLVCLAVCTVGCSKGLTLSEGKVWPWHSSPGSLRLSPRNVWSDKSVCVYLGHWPTPHGPCFGVIDVGLL